MNGPNGTAGSVLSAEAGGVSARLIDAASVVERRLNVAGVSTALLEGGDGPPVVLLHGQGGFAAMWAPIITGLVPTHHVIAPDLPGLGASVAPDGPPGAETVLAWLDDLISVRPAPRRPCWSERRWAAPSRLASLRCTATAWRSWCSSTPAASPGRSGRLCPSCWRSSGTAPGRPGAAPSACCKGFHWTRTAFGDEWAIVGSHSGTICSIAPGPRAFEARTEGCCGSSAFRAFRQTSSPEFGFRPR